MLLLPGSRSRTKVQSCRSCMRTAIEAAVVKYTARWGHSALVLEPLQHVQRMRAMVHRGANN